MTFTDGLKNFAEGFVWMNSTVYALPYMASHSFSNDFNERLNSTSSRDNSLNAGVALGVVSMIAQIPIGLTLFGLDYFAIVGATNGVSLAYEKNNLVDIY